MRPAFSLFFQLKTFFRGGVSGPIAESAKYPTSQHLGIHLGVQLIPVGPQTGTGHSLQASFEDRSDLQEL